MSFSLQSNVGKVSALLERKLEQVVSDTAHNIQGHIRTDMAEEKHGRKYGNHVASAPGESPAIDTGFLANSIQVEADGLTASVGTNAEYAEHLEFGTSRMEPRPFFGPAFEAERPVFEKALADALK